MCRTYYSVLDRAEAETATSKRATSGLVFPANTVHAGASKGIEIDHHD